MVRVFGFLSLLVLFFIGGLEIARWLKNDPFRGKGEQASEWTFQPTAYPIENLPFVVAMIGRNNGAWLEKSLQSAFFQNYSNYRIVYVDDGSDDGSFELARDLISTNPSKALLIRNEIMQGVLVGLSQIVQACSDQEIVVVLQGEDRLAHEWVLQRLNQYYANKELWMTYGQYLYENTYQFGRCLAMDQKEPRSAPFCASHLKTFYAKLFRHIREGDLLLANQGVGAEMALMIPMLEMAKGHTAYIPDILCIANKQNEDPELVSRIEAQIKLKNPYSPIQTLFEEMH